MRDRSVLSGTVLLLLAAAAAGGETLSVDQIIERNTEARGGYDRIKAIRTLVAHPEIDTRAGVEVIGYQMLKMGEIDEAIALLEANARDHPDSSSSAFGLGRAYDTAGDKDRARAEYQRALRLDPDNRRARRALEALLAAEPEADGPP